MRVPDPVFPPARGSGSSLTWLTAPPSAPSSAKILFSPPQSNLLWSLPSSSGKHKPQAWLQHSQHPQGRDKGSTERLRAPPALGASIPLCCSRDAANAQQTNPACRGGAGRALSARGRCPALVEAGAEGSSARHPQDAAQGQAQLSLLLHLPEALGMEGRPSNSCHCPQRWLRSLICPETAAAPDHTVITRPDLH